MQHAWHYDIFGCFGDLPVMFDVCCCTPCNIARQCEAVKGTENRLNVPLCLGALILSPLAPLFTCVLRLKVVEKYGLDERTPKTVLFGLCCAACSTCQTYREQSVRYTWPGATIPMGCHGPRPVGLTASDAFAGGYVPTSRSVSRI